MWMTRFVVSAALAVGTLVAAPSAAASAPSFCEDLGGSFDGHFCNTEVHSERNATRYIHMAVPGDLIEHPTAGPPIRDYLTKLFTNWRSKGASMVQDSFGNENYEIFQHGNALSAVFHEDYHADGPWINNAYKTFTFDMAQGRQLQLPDVFKDGVDPYAEIPVLGNQYIVEALDRAFWEHSPGSYPFTPDRWTPDKAFSGGYRSWALTPTELILYMPDYPVGHDSPVQYDQLQQWSMDGGNVQAHIPLSALAAILRPEYGGA
ncbi:DUF3298 domain-containing protein [Mycobacterium koreense]|uniref:Mannan-binding protein n=1 Tax=Mycolicibacillus koreensis TaxID=1069220 RepID=A0A7I7SFU5_9MYCO|nr:mannan-binding protein [Mycolicibacillus koreensis]MCV7248714.1 DUF3298 domain-containing protein [Mycolicibacillus koreensis]ODR05932.1 mannan-binding protein [Mycolicibacillus koreensis]OSC33401.1 mannan-binding protein [Mycolicibacillus koreensis]BBY55678.1 hypothetical protein MKOR_29290 [Mycolicibacillus koreensis]